MDSNQNVQWLQMVVPMALQTAFISACHSGITRGHLGPRQIAQQVQRRVLHELALKKLSFLSPMH